MGRVAGFLVHVLSLGPLVCKHRPASSKEGSTLLVTSRLAFALLDLQIWGLDQMSQRSARWVFWRSPGTPSTLLGLLVKELV